MTKNLIPQDFLKNVLQNGVGRYVCQLQRITLRFCKSHGASRHMRDFIENHLLGFSQKNPGVAVYLQPRRHRAPSIVAEYLNGYREVLFMSDKQPSEICKWTEHLRTRSGVQIVKMINNIHTETPSTQGIWHPFMFRDTELAVTKFPNKKLSSVLKTGKTATDIILDEQTEALTEGVKHCQINNK
ncbi:39S ribosomal protein L43 mitochondrial [Biomphalaria pfeifferi]|uniref:Large ribosomal subunit protein mL43 n=1 Tax=Biomphalaria pfeifferi TaxID=112525 RepID=A0AAD8AY71_BIOPF|nr:39S ribosomal protein L43 mitochondrial [Biomphalaria pfeifferi]